MKPTVIDDDECGICGSDQIWGRVLTPLDGFLWLCADCYADATGETFPGEEPAP